MRRLTFPLAILIVAFAASSNAWAWLSTGHRIVAVIVWDELTPAAKAKVTEILKQHPRYAQDLLADLPDALPDESIQRFAVASAATWPDMVRSLSNPMHAAYNHPSWHYIDIPFAINGQVVPPPPPPREASGPHNLVEALTAKAADLRDPAVSGPDKAIALCWVLHLCGDIHQPLHAASFYSPQFPNGDQGGNGMIVLREPPYPDSRSNLHLVWDSLPGNFMSRDFEYYIADGLRADPQYSREKLKDLLDVKDFAAWAQESHDLAVKYAYLNGQLVGLDSHAQITPDTQIPGLPRGYLKTAEGIAEQRIILAGYRLADLLNSIFDK